MINGSCPIYTLVFYQCVAIATVLQYRTAFYGVFRTLVDPALAHHHPSPNNSPPDLEGGTTIADDEGGSIP
jgi:hypothetical protein